MYIMEDMIDMGLKEDQEWPSEIYRNVAEYILLCNSNINTRDKLESGVQKILKIPCDRISKITFGELSEFGFSISTSIDVIE